MKRAHAWKLLRQDNRFRDQPEEIILAAVKSFMHFIEYRVPSALDQVRRILAIPEKKTDTRLAAHLEVNEMQAVLDAPDPTTRYGIRDRAMLHLGFAAGLRVSELVGLQLRITPGNAFHRNTQSMTEAPAKGGRMGDVEQYPDQEGGRLGDLAVPIPASRLRRLQ